MIFAPVGFARKIRLMTRAKFTHRIGLETSFEDVSPENNRGYESRQGDERQSLVADQVSADPASSSSGQNNAG
jgi:hypothetical protein